MISGLNPVKPLVIITDKWTKISYNFCLFQT
jgi:hypothetical protein